MDQLINACSRPTLAESALYAYPRGSTMVTGPSIRLAEAIAQSWGNMQFGIRELSQDAGESSVEAFAWDIENNTKQVKTFQVPHIRHTRAGATKLEDPRDIYETVANQGARRLRACILGIVPGDIIDAAQRQCELTQESAHGATEDQIEKLVSAFDDLGVNRKQIEKAIGHRIDSLISAEMVRLRKIYASIRDGMAKPADFFAAAVSDESEEIMQRARAGQEGQFRPPPPPEDEQDEWPQEVDGVLVDARGVPWTQAFYSQKKTCNDDGTWRSRRGAIKEAVRQYEQDFIAPKPAEPHADVRDAVDVHASTVDEPPETLTPKTMREKIDNATGTMDLDEKMEIVNRSNWDKETKASLLELASQYRADWLEVERAEKEEQPA
jgi:hypothetical protein